MSSMGYCFNICRTVDKNITQERRSSTCNPTLLNIPIPANTGALIFGRRFSLSHMAVSAINSASSSSTSQQQLNSSSDQDTQSN